MHLSVATNETYLPQSVNCGKNFQKWLVGMILFLTALRQWQELITDALPLACVFSL
jgi:hypothetical protein